MNPPSEYYKSFMQLISESTMKSIIITEKTATPLMNFKPFLVAGPKDYYKVMDELGFQRYTELFDYDFDKEPDDAVRTEMVVENIKKNAYLSTNQMAELHIKMGPKLLHNYNRMIEIALDFDNWHPLAKECIDHYMQSEEYGLDKTYRTPSQYEGVINSYIVNSYNTLKLFDIVTR